LAGGSVVWGAVATHYGLIAAITGSAATFGVLRLLSQNFVVELEARASLSQADPVEVEVRMTEPQRSWPVVVMIEYRVPDARIFEFRNLMQQRRLMRLRNGARSWMLMRSTEDAGLWTEQFRSKSWTHHLQYRARRTLDDVSLQARINALHSGDQPPRLRYYLDAAE